LTKFEIAIFPRNNTPPFLFYGQFMTCNSHLNESPNIIKFKNLMTSERKPILQKLLANSICRFTVFVSCLFDIYIDVCIVVLYQDPTSKVIYLVFISSVNH
jgi:hypothetical protein